MEWRMSVSQTVSCQAVRSLQFGPETTFESRMPSRKNNGVVEVDTYRRMEIWTRGEW